MSSVAFTRDYQESLRLVEEHRMSEALVELARLRPVAPREHRMVGHLRAQLLMKKDDYEAALQELRRIRREWGDHVGLLSDIAVCCYLLGNVSAWLEAIDCLAQAWRENESRLNAECFIRTGILVGKFEEERGELARAIEIYESILRYIAGADFHTSVDAQEACSRSMFMTLTQLVRIRSLYQPNAKLKILYSSLSRLNTERAVDGLNIEAEYSLIQAELALTGAWSAFPRLRRVLNEDRLAGADRNLALFDFIEALLRLGDREVLSALHEECTHLQIESLSAYDRGLLAMAFESSWEPTSGFIDDVIRGTSQSGSLRFLTLICRRYANHPFCEAVRQKLTLLLSDVSAESRALWLTLFHHA